MTDLFGLAGNELITGCDLAGAYRNRVESLRHLLEVLDKEVSLADVELYRRLRDDAGWKAVQAISGVGPVLASVFVAEIGEVTRSSRPTGSPPGAGSRRATASPTPRSTAAPSPSRARGS